MRKEQEDAVEMSKQDFKRQLIVNHPDKADQILSIFSDEDELPEALTEDEIDELGPLTGEQVEQALDDLRRVGLSFVTDS